MKRTKLLAVLLAFLLAMPIAAAALPTVTELRIFCSDSTDTGSILSDLPGIAHESHGSPGYLECLKAASTMITENRNNVRILFTLSNWMEDEDLHHLVNLNICLNRHLSKWPMGSICNALLE